LRRLRRELIESGMADSHTKILLGLAAGKVYQNQSDAILKFMEKKKWYRDSKVWIISSWFLGFICVYLLMTVLNIYIYQFYPIDERFGLLFYAKQSIKIGGVLGFGIGLGNFIVQLLSKTNIIKL